MLHFLIYGWLLSEPFGLPPRILQKSSAKNIYAKGGGDGVAPNFAKKNITLALLGEIFPESKVADFP